MKCRGIGCRNEALKDDPRCGPCMIAYERRIRRATKDLKPKPPPIPTPSRKP